MPLPLPNLDTRRWIDLVDEARAIIPRYAPNWTDHNVHDPGLTLVELLAWLVERDVYRTNRVPEAHRRKFLALLGITPRPPQAATTILGLAPPGPVAIPAGAEFDTAPGERKTYTFRAVEPLSAVPAVLSAILVQSEAGGLPQDRTRLWREEGQVALLGDDPRAGAALWLGFDQPLPEGQPVRLALTFAGSRSGPAERQRIQAEAEAQQEACRRPVPSAPCAEPPAGAAAGSEPIAWLHHSVRLVWEFYTTAGNWQPLDPAAGEVSDDTRAFTLDGTVTVRLPALMGLYDAGSGGPRPYLRARVESGEYDTPPLLAGLVVNGLAVEQAVPLSRIYVINAGVVAAGPAPTPPGPARLALQLDAAGAISGLAFVTGTETPETTVLAYQPATATEPGFIVLNLVLLGPSSGQPGQRFRLPRSLVQGGSLALYTLEPPGASPADVTWQAWQLRPDLDAATGRDPFVLLDETAASISFGDGDAGRIPPAGAPVLVSYRATAADLGNQSAGQIKALAPSLANWLLFDPADFQAKVAALGLEVIAAADPGRVWQQHSPTGYSQAAGQLGAISQPFPAGGGSAAESVAAAAGRAVTALQTPTRAVTASDYEILTQATPGTAIARTRALPGRHPAYPCLAAPGVVTVMIVPAQRRSQPTPSAGLLAAVRRYLERRRILGTHVEVVGPGYVVVQVKARVRLLPGASGPRVQADVIAALNAFLNPLSGGPAAIAAPARRSQQQSPPAPAPVTGLAPGVNLLAPAPPPPPALPAAPPPEPGWPFGRDVYRAEILQVIDGVAGVDNVLSLELSGNGGPAQCGNLCVGPTELVVPGVHTIEVLGA